MSELGLTGKYKNLAELVTTAAELRRKADEALLRGNIEEICVLLNRITEIKIQLEELRYGIANDLFEAIKKK